MKIFITGSNGFIGKELISQCKKQGIEFIGVDFKKASGQNCYQADIRSKDIVKFIPHEADAIVHLAALSSDIYCKNRAYDCFDINVMGTLNLIKAAEEKKIKQFIFASSEWVYDNCKEGEIKDEESFINIANHNSEYALSKLVSEANLRHKYQHGFCSVTILRFGIIYGLRKEGSAVEFLFQAVKNKEEIRIGSLKNGRCFIHVSDIASGIIQSIGLDGFNIINLVGDRLIKLGAIIENSKNILNRNPKIIEINPGNINIRNISNIRAKKILNWRPKINLKSGLNELKNL